MIRSAHVDTFAADHLPPPDAQPVFLLDQPFLRYGTYVNAVTELLDAHVAAGRGDRPCVKDDSGSTWTYAALADRVDRIAHVLLHGQGLVPGNRVLLRGPNSPMMLAATLAVIKAGGIAVPTMPLLRAKELSFILGKARISHALLDARLREELDRAEAPELRHVTTWHDGALEAAMARAQAPVPACSTAATDICLFGFTSGTTGVPKATMHNHRDLLAICDSYGAQVLRPRPDDLFIGSPPLAFTFGLGGLALFPLRVGAATVLLERAAPPDLLAAIARHRATVCFTAPTAYRVMAQQAAGADLTSLRTCVSAGEHLPRATFDLWHSATGLHLMDGIGATEMLHIFIGAPPEAIRPGSTGLVVPGYQAKVLAPDGTEAPRGTPGRLAVRGPTGCRYLADERQASYVQHGWNVTGDTFSQDQDGYFWYHARNDDMIVSAGYNIAGPEVEAALLTHPLVRECGVVGEADAERGMVVKAYVVPAPEASRDDATVRALQDHVKAEIAPYKYPRRIVFVDRLPRTETGKLQRFALRQGWSG
jgi:2-aminobenzoate-CoA ligase